MVPSLCHVHSHYFVSPGTYFDVKLLMGWGDRYLACASCSHASLFSSSQRKSFSSELLYLSSLIAKILILNVLLGWELLAQVLSAKEVRGPKECCGYKVKVRETSLPFFEERRWMDV